MNPTSPADREITPDRGPRASDPYRVLHLLSSAPHDLVVDVYWHLVHRLRKAAGDPDAARELLRLNQAYAMLTMTPDAGAGSAGSPDNDRTARTPATEHREREPSRRAASTDTLVSPWQRLHVQQDAPQDVVDLAYEFWRVRLRSQAGGPGEDAAEHVRAAYLAIRDGTASVPGIEAVAPQAVAAGVTGQEGGSTRALEAPSAGGWVSVLARLAWERLRVWAPRAWRLARLIGVGIDAPALGGRELHSAAGARAG